MFMMIIPLPHYDNFATNIFSGRKNVSEYGGP